MPSNESDFPCRSCDSLSPFSGVLEDLVLFFHVHSSRLNQTSLKHVPMRNTMLLCYRKYKKKFLLMCYYLLVEFFINFDSTETRKGLTKCI